MKKYLCFIALISIICMIGLINLSCSHGAGSVGVENKSNLKSENVPLSDFDANAKMIRYLTLKNNHYYFSLSKDEAIKLGVSITQFEKAVLDVKNVNNYISKMNPEELKKTHLFDPSKITQDSIMKIKKEKELLNLNKTTK